MNIDERVAQSAAKVKEWSSKDVRKDEHRFCGMTEEQMRALWEVRIPAPVTLEGLAAVIGALAPLYGHDTHIAECVDNLALKARELACGEASMTGGEALTALETAKVEAYNRAIADAHVAIGDAIGSKAASFALEAQAAVRAMIRVSK